VIRWTSNVLNKRNNILENDDRSCYSEKVTFHGEIYYWTEVGEISRCTVTKNQRLPGACNRSPGSKLLSITTQLHCGGDLGGRARLKVWFQLSDWFQTRRFLCEFPIGSFVKLSSAVGAILVEGSNRLTYFWKRTIQWLFNQNFVLIEQMVSDKKIFMGISHRVLC
jgi:hypothetical protein